MAHELAASRRVRKGLLPSVTPPDARGAEPVVPDAPSPSPSTSPSPTIGERVVADVRHEIGNYFHKLYYWADFLSDSRNGRPGDVTATQMLEETIRGLEDLLHATLEYVRPIAVTPIRMHAREVADGVVRQLATGLPGRTIVTSIDDTVPTDRAVLVDPGRLSQLLGALARRLDAATDDGRLEIRVSAELRGTVEVIAVRASGTAKVVVHSTLTEVEWATAENVARLIGGELAMHDAGGRTTVTLTLPLRS
jgi:signal transduction histidine kinase